MNEKEEFEKIKEACLSEGIKILVEDIKENKKSSDTIMIMPLLDDRGNIISSSSDEMMKRLGYVQGLSWILGIIDYYQTSDYSEDEV